MTAIPTHVVTAYVRRYPHLRHLMCRIDVPASERAFANSACNLAAPAGVTALEIYHLAGVATGTPWPVEV